MRDAVAAFGRDPAEIEVLGHIPLVVGRDGQPDIGPSMETARTLVDAGVTNVDAFLPVPDELHAAEDYLVKWVAAFREAMDRGVRRS
jgi:hypothetical protein